MKELLKFTLYFLWKGSGSVDARLIKGLCIVAVWGIEGWMRISGGKGGNTIYLCYFSLHGLQKVDLEVRLHIN